MLISHWLLILTDWCDLVQYVMFSPAKSSTTKLTEAQTRPSSTDSDDVGVLDVQVSVWFRRTPTWLLSLLVDDLAGPHRNLCYVRQPSSHTAAPLTSCNVQVRCPHAAQCSDQITYRKTESAITHLLSLPSLTTFVLYFTIKVPWTHLMREITQC